MDKFYHSVHLDELLCKGCTHCLKRCPTEAIRIRDGKSFITKEFCIDCGECIRICPRHAKVATYDKLEVLNNFKYKVALPSPALYAQFNNMDDINIILSGLKQMGFDDVYEVSGAAEIVSQMSRKYTEEHEEQWPFISSSCPSIVRLIRVKFPNLIEHLLPFKAPIDIAAENARKLAVEKSGLPEEDIGIIFISPCPAQVSVTQSPLGIEKSGIDAVLSVKDVYPLLLSKMKDLDQIEIISISGKIGINWGASGGEARGLVTDSYLAAGGIENAIRVLEDIEDKKIPHLRFIELNACHAGCVGGVLNVENPFVARVKLKALGKYLPVACSRLEVLDEEEMKKGFRTQDISYEPVFKLGEDMADSMAKLAKIEEICKALPGLDCGSCGAPTCRALAEDVVRGVVEKTHCIHVLRQMYKM